MSIRPFSQIEEELIVAAIRYAEHKTSGELRVHIEPACPSDPFERAVTVFAELEMEVTKERNGVLIYLAFDDKKYAIVGDVGIHQKLGDQYWNNIKQIMFECFSQGQLAAGVVKAIIDIGHQLAVHFPTLTDDADELNNDISYA